MQKQRWYDLSLVLVLFLSLMPVPSSWGWWLPEWACLMVLFWTLYSPKKPPILSFFLLGCLIDFFQGGLLGMQGLSMVMLAYLTDWTRLRFAFYPLWQQSILIGMFTLLYLNILYWIETLIKGAHVPWAFWGSALTTALCWPALIFLMNHKPRKGLSSSNADL